MKASLFHLGTALIWLFLSLSVKAEAFTIAAASDLRFALDEIVELYQQEFPEHELTVIYGSSGQFYAQISNGAPYDLYFSADISYPRLLHAAGLALSEPEVYARGRIVLWSSSTDASELRLEDLNSNRFRRIAIAQPDHAPYGQRAREALQSAGIWEQIQPKLVFGENIAHAVQMTESGAADIGIIALSLALFPGMTEHGYHLIDEALHEPLTQAFVITRYGRNKSAVLNFTRYMESETAQTIMKNYGFELGE